MARRQPHEEWRKSKPRERNVHSPEIAHTIQEPRLDSESENGGGRWFEC